MSRITGIELGRDWCVLTRVRAVGGAAEVSAVHTIDRAAWLRLDGGVVAALREARRQNRFPRRAVVVAWGLSDPATPDTPYVQPLLLPLLEAGFKVNRLLTAPEALAALARLRPRPFGEGRVWLALNTQGAAIAILRDRELLFTRSFDWTYSPNPAGPRAELLQRYSLVAHLAPEVRRGISMARNAHGATVNVAVTCGNLPDLRSLTMPLIEELELEVETLDSAEGLVPTGSARTDRFEESAPALRLAIAAACSSAPAQARRPASVGPLLRLAAAAVIVASIGWVAWQQFDGTRAKPAGVRVAPTAPQTRSVPNTAKPQTTQPVAKPLPPTETAAQLAAKLPQSAERPAQPSAAPPTPRTQPTEKPTSPAAAAPSAEKPTQRPLQTAPPPPPPAIVTVPPVVTTRTSPSRSVTTPNPPTPSPGPVIAEPSPALPIAAEELQNAVARPARPARPPVPLKHPVPVVESILISHNRRVAVIDGAIVGIGGSVGPRVVIRIERNGVVLREPSGYELHVPLRRASGAG